MASRTDAERAADVPKVEREAVKQSEAAKAAERVRDVPSKPVEDAVVEADTREAAAEAVEDAPEENPVVATVVVDEDALYASEQEGPLRVAFAGSHEVEGADDDGYVEPPFDVTADQAAVAVGLPYVKVEPKDAD